MAQIQVGDTVRIRRYGDREWLVHSKQHDGRWHCFSVDLDVRSGKHSGLTVGEGDMVVLREAPLYAVGQQVRFNGRSAVVLEDNDSGTVTLSVPPQRFRTRAGDHLHVPPSRAEVPKADLILQNLEGVTPL